MPGVTTRLPGGKLDFGNYTYSNVVVSKPFIRDILCKLLLYLLFAALGRFFTCHERFAHELGAPLFYVVLWFEKKFCHYERLRGRYRASKNEK